MYSMPIRLRYDMIRANYAATAQPVIELNMQIQGQMQYLFI